jgi:hypothetical protein
MKASTKFFIAFGIIFILMFLVESAQEDPIDWSPGFSKNQKKPFGCFLLNEILPAIFKDKKIETINYNVMEEINDNPGVTGINYIFIDENLSFNEYECNALLHFVSEGNQVFLAAESFPDSLMNSMPLKLRYRYDDTTFNGIGNLYHINFCDHLKTSDTGYVLSNDYTMANTYLDSLSNSRRWVAADEKRHCVMADVEYGNGKFIFCTLPHAFSNYALIRKDNAGFAAMALSRMPLQTTWWDEYYKSGKNKDSPLHIILSRRALRWAYYIGIGGLLLFVIFMGKRRQRIIPVQDPMKNTSLEFAETVGQVYYAKKDHADLARKQIKYFYEYVRSRYHFNINQELKNNPAAFIDQLSNRTGIPAADLDHIFRMIRYIEHSPDVNEKELIELNRLIDKVKNINTT